MNDDGSQSLPAERGSGGWMIAGLLGPYQGTRTDADAHRDVLLVELSPARAAALTRALAAVGRKVHAASDIAQALEQLSRGVPALVVLGAGCSDASPLIAALADSYRRGLGPKLVADPGEAEDVTSERLNALLGGARR